MVDIISHRPDGITRDDLMGVLYAEDPNGGPVNLNVISVLIYHANKQLHEQGYTIKTTWRGRGSRYKLMRLDDAGTANRSAGRTPDARAIQGA
jgi:hypothetical protein